LQTGRLKPLLGKNFIYSNTILINLTALSIAH
jgi:hypothetical protein